ncbi:hypothetical protein LZ30DRAFT_719645 [Colletotrichum cereale]|nr:hypothetical protein LZ30DRAFT_719645 [Colletotrichum cereale]
MGLGPRAWGEPGGHGASVGNETRTGAWVSDRRWWMANRDDMKPAECSRPGVSPDLGAVNFPNRH